MKIATQNQRCKIKHIQLSLFLYLFSTAFFPLMLKGEAPLPLITLNDFTYFFFSTDRQNVNVSSSQVLVLIGFLLGCLSHANNKAKTKCKDSTIASVKAIIQPLKKMDSS